MLSARETWVTSKSGKVKVFGEFVLDYKMPGLFAWKYKNTHTHSNTCIKNITHTYTGDSSLGGVFCHLPGFPTPVLNVNSLFSFVLGGGGGMMQGNKNNKQQKGSPTMPLSSWHLVPLSPSLHPPLPRSISRSLPLCSPPFTFTLPHRISLSSALESSSVSAYAEAHSEKT